MSTADSYHSQAASLIARAAETTLKLKKHTALKKEKIDSLKRKAKVCVDKAQSIENEEAEKEKVKE